MGVGTVALVGAGPGAADLISVRGRRLLRGADLVIVDALLPRTLLDDLGMALGEKTVEWLGAGETRKTQAEINALMRTAAREGRRVVRLKTGDPFVFGRGGEEVAFLTEHGIAFEVVPGITAATAAPAAAALSLTQRGESRSFAVATAREVGGTAVSSFPRAENLVILMGVSALDEVTQTLLADGWAAETPAAIIERATLPWERRAQGPLAQIARLAAEASITAPAVLVIGPAAAAPPRPRILFTGLDPTHFRALGDLIHWPALQIVDDEEGHRTLPAVADALRRTAFDRVIFTSKVGVDSLMRALRERGLDARALAGAQIVVAGAGTAARLGEHGLRADAVATQAGSQGILELVESPPAGHALLVQGSHAPRGLEETLRARGGDVTRLALHRVIPHPDLGRALPAHDVIYFVSPSGVRSCWEQCGEAAFAREIWCIGEVTRDALAALGKTGKVVDPHDPTPHTDAARPAH